MWERAVFLHALQLSCVTTASLPECHPLRAETSVSSGHNKQDTHTLPRLNQDLTSLVPQCGIHHPAPAWGPTDAPLSVYWGRGLPPRLVHGSPQGPGWELCCVLRPRPQCPLLTQVCCVCSGRHVTGTGSQKGGRRLREQRQGPGPHGHKLITRPRKLWETPRSPEVSKCLSE